MAGKDDPNYLASLRKTERMGTTRDTVKDPPRTFDEVAPSDPGPSARVLGPRGTMVVPKKSAEPDAGKTDPAGAETNVAGQVVIGTSRQPRTGVDGKIDVSRADPRRAPTRKLDRRPEQYLPPDSSLKSRPRRKGGVSPMMVGIVLVAVLAAIAILLGLLALRQRSGAH